MLEALHTSALITQEALSFLGLERSEHWGLSPLESPHVWSAAQGLLSPQPARKLHQLRGSPGTGSSSLHQQHPEEPGVREWGAGCASHRPSSRGPGLPRTLGMGRADPHGLATLQAGEGPGWGGVARTPGLWWQLLHSHVLRYLWMRFVGTLPAPRPPTHGDVGGPRSQGQRSTGIRWVICPGTSLS